ncbi:MAG: hypothetical protein AAF768_05340 [Pseudomonadota bacterium]
MPHIFRAFGLSVSLIVLAGCSHVSPAIPETEIEFEASDADPVEA